MGRLWAALCSIIARLWGARRAIRADVVIGVEQAGNATTILIDAFIGVRKSWRVSLDKIRAVLGKIRVLYRDREGYFDVEYLPACGAFALLFKACAGDETERVALIPLKAINAAIDFIGF